MKTPLFTEEFQIIKILKQAEASTPVPELFFEYGMSLPSFYKWREKPMTIRCDNGPEYITSTLAAWAEKRGVQISF